MADGIISPEMDSKLKLAARCLHVCAGAYGAAKEEAKLRKEDLDQAQEALNLLIDELYPPAGAAPLFGGGTEDSDHD